VKHLVAGMGLGLPCLAVRVVLHAVPGRPQQWHTVTRRDGESEQALADRAMAIAVELARGGHAPAWFMLQNVTHVSELAHPDEWHNTRFACHHMLHDPSTCAEDRIEATRRLMALHDNDEQPDWIQ